MVLSGLVLAPNRMPEHPGMLEPRPQLSTTITNANDNANTNDNDHQCNTNDNDHQYNTNWDEYIYLKKQFNSGSNDRLDALGFDSIAKFTARA
jgi:hypothetical protein